MKYCKPELSFFIFTSYERSECFIFGVKRKMLHNEVASSEKASFLWSTPVGVWSILRHCRKIWSTADAVWSKAFSGFMFFCLVSRQKKWRLEIFIFPRHSELHFEAKTSEFCCEMKFWKSLHFSSEKLRMYSNGKRKLTKTAKIFHLPLAILLMEISFLGGLMHGYRRSCKAA